MSSLHIGESAELLEQAISSIENKRYCLTPINMVPNGPPHLGHISGPLLKMDVLNRHLLRLGASSIFVTTTDVHETHVEVQAVQEGLTCEEVANKYHEIICRDLKHLNIEYDALINPLDPSWSQKYVSITQDLFDALLGEGNIVAESESLPRRADNDSLVLGGWLAGNCPNCLTSLVSFFCEKCGAQTKPILLKNPQHRTDEVELVWTNEVSLFLRPPIGIDIIDRLMQMKVRNDFLLIAKEYVYENGNKFRVSLPTTWGIPINDDRLTEPSCSFSYSLAINAAQILSGEYYAEREGKNPFLANEDVVIVSSFGVDNAVPMLIGVQGIGLCQKKYRAPDRYLVNYFATLDGEKFSTNRRHAIWAADVAIHSTIPSDFFRVYMLRTSPEFEEADFDQKQFEESSIKFSDKLARCIATARDVSANCPDNFVGDSGYELIANQFKAGLLAQIKALDLDGEFNSIGVVHAVDEFIDFCLSNTPKNQQEAYWQMKCLCFLVDPIMPDLGKWLRELTLLEGAVNWQGLDFAAPGALQLKEGLHPPLVRPVET